MRFARVVVRFPSRRAVTAAVLVGSLVAGVPARADQDRERAQMLQMQQQLQRLQSDNAAIQKERSDLQAKAQEADKLKKLTEQNGKDLARARSAATAQARELAAAKADLAAVREQLRGAQEENEQLRKVVAQRDTALQVAADEKRKGENDQALLQARLKFQTGHADLCEQRHEAVMKFSEALINRYEGDRLRLCEPITGIWKVKAETQIQQLRDELYTYRLDVPGPAPATALPPSADSRAAAGPAVH